MEPKITTPASEKDLANIHALTADLMKQRLKSAIDTGEPLPPAELGAITKFLKDNGIECVREDLEEKFGDVLQLEPPSFESLEYGI